MKSALGILGFAAIAAIVILLYVFAVGPATSGVVNISGQAYADTPSTTALSVSFCPNGPSSASCCSTIGNSNCIVATVSNGMYSAQVKAYTQYQVILRYEYFFAMLSCYAGSVTPTTLTVYTVHCHA